MPAMKFRPTFPALSIVVLAASLCAATGHAAEKKEGAFGKGGSGAYLTRDQLRTCLARQDKVRQQSDEMSKEQAALTTMKADIQRSGEELKAKLEALDRTNAEAVAAYNDEAGARDKRIDEFQTRADAFNARVASNKTDQDAFGKGCENRRYFEEDEIAIRKEKK